MRLHVGCAMWSLKSWQGRFLPVSGTDRLRSYAGWCNAVEGNTTFYATPTLATVAGWAEQAPAGFRFVLKLPREVTHGGALADVAALSEFLRVIEPLGDRVHALWAQLPGSFGPGDLPALSRFLRGLPDSFRYAVEVRDPVFFHDPDRLEDVLAAAGAEWVPFDTTEFFRTPPTSDAERDAWLKKPRMPLRTAALTDRPIVRYLGRDATDRTVGGWQRWVPIVAGWLREGRSPTFFVHTPDNADAPELCRRFHDEVRALVPQLEPLPVPPPLSALEPEGPPTLF
ncbi:hypothetical protein Aph02nite_13330 [Actinoplanes philippinensis]|uniref:Uncharacterized conserved protein YecE, DUF72 family n=1 Tax=Actinoplanes philippinensis TaxID=35752 RepID=A0A1I1ZN44_9ACTN|nr:DUF72 domain-containing protein [Actinoplanes philippinensis]GIE75383.1 hypothetical protein Aph02nite_13330 [Actinoplanes philippinensis]SFE33234.1 Uncharacterized conserved protein YecE, DUF72 family [Actinoplanes philippinensis]